jgi:hypothetical protein
VTVAGVLVALAYPAAGGAVDVHTSSGKLRASLTLVPTPDGEWPFFESASLRVIRAGRQVEAAQPKGIGSVPRRSGFRFVQLDDDADRELVLLTSGQCASACTVFFIWNWNQKKYELINAGSRDGVGLRDLDSDGSLEILTSDSRFTCRYTSCAERYAMPMIQRLKGRNLVNATRRFPSLVRKQASDAMKYYLSSRNGGTGSRGALAVYVGLTCYRGPKLCEQALRLVESEVSGGYLNASSTYDDSASVFLAKLRSDLLIFGYRQ